MGKGLKFWGQQKCLSAYKRLRYLFLFDQPSFSALTYVDVVFEDQSYLIISWSLNNGFGIHIKELGFYSFHQTGSAYLAIPSNVDLLHLKTYNTWRKNEKVIVLKKAPVNFNLDFPMHTEIPKCGSSKLIGLKNILIQPVNHSVKICFNPNLQTYIPQPNLKVYHE